MKVNILGTEYTVLVKKYDEEEAFERRSIDGYCDGYTKEIVAICTLIKGGNTKQKKQSLKRKDTHYDTK